MRFLKRLLLLSFLFLGSPMLMAGTVDINTAGVELLAAELHGVGEKKAAEIVKYREQNGPFKSIEELTKVKGIGDTILEKNRLRIVADIDGDQG